jgi:hypothetical protein
LTVLLLNLIAAPVHVLTPVPTGISLLTVIVAKASSKSVASHVPSTALLAFTTDAMLAVTVLTWTNPVLELLKLPEMI